MPSITMRQWADWIGHMSKRMAHRAVYEHRGLPLRAKLMSRGNLQPRNPLVQRCALFKDASPRAMPVATGDWDLPSQAVLEHIEGTSNEHIVYDYDGFMHVEIDGMTPSYDDLI